MTERKELTEEERKEISRQQISKTTKQSVASKALQNLDSSSSNPSIFGLLVFGICCFCLGAQYTSTEVLELLRSSGILVAAKEATTTALLLCFSAVSARFVYLSKSTSLRELVEKTIFRKS